jgi:alcohol dehydrogenase
MRANVAGTLLTGARRFHHFKAPVLHHHLGVSGFSQFTVAARQSLVKIDKDLASDEAALFGCAVLTGVGAIVNTSKVEPGASVAIFGLGGVGLSAVMGAKLVSADPIIAIDVLDEKLGLATKLGATHTLNPRNVDVVKTVKEITGGGAHYAIECSGIDAVGLQAFEATRRGGETVYVGLPDPQKRLPLPPVTIVGEERTVRGSYMGSAIPSRDVPRYISLYRAGRLPVRELLSRTVSLDDINSAFDRLDRGEAVRQIVAF